MKTLLRLAVLSLCIAHLLTHVPLWSSGDECGCVSFWQYTNLDPVGEREVTPMRVMAPIMRPFQPVLSRLMDFSVWPTPPTWRAMPALS